MFRVTVVRKKCLPRAGDNSIIYQSSVKLDCDNLISAYYRLQTSAVQMNDSELAVI